MKAQSTGPVLSTVFVDYDNIYLSLKRKSEEAAKRFAKDAGLWLREIESGRLITATNGSSFAMPRRIVMTRCYGNPVPRRNANDNSTDMNSFPFVRHHFLRAGFEVIDCPPADGSAQEFRRHPHGDGRPRRPQPRHAIRRIHHPLRRRRLHAGAASACARMRGARSCSPTIIRRRPTPRSAMARFATPISWRSCSKAASRTTARPAVRASSAPQARPSSR